MLRQVGADARKLGFAVDRNVDSKPAPIKCDNYLVSRLVEINLTRLSYVNKSQTLTVPCSLFPVP